MKSLILTLALATAFGAAGGTGDDRDCLLGNAKTLKERFAAAKVAGSSEFPVPKASDVRFVASSGGNLGAEVWSRGVIEFPLTIDRYYGTKGDIEKLIKNKALADHAVLTMIIWDVDDHSTYNPPEHDRVTFNKGDASKEYALGDLTGQNAKWTKQTFRIPIDKINLPTSPGETAVNTIHIDVGYDSQPGDWVTAVYWASLDIPAAPPVVFAHGINSGSYAFDKLEKKIKDEFGLYTAKTNFSNNGNDYIGNYEALEKVIQKVKQDCRVEKVNIVAHSMGGLRSRAYAENHNDVMKVLQVATPNGGSPIADFMIQWKKNALVKVAKLVTDGKMTVLQASEHLNKIRDAVSKMSKETFNMKLDPWEDEAVVCLQTSFMRDYNTDHRLKSDVDYGVVAGCIPDVPLALKLIANSWMVGAAMWYYEDSINDFVDKMLKIDDKATAEYVREYLKQNVIDLVKEMWEDSDGIVKVKSAHTMVPKLAKSALHGSYAEVWHSGLLEDGVNKTFDSIRDKLKEKREPDSISRKPFARSMRQNARTAKRGAESLTSADAGAVGLMTGLLVGGSSEIYSFDVVKGGETIVNVAVNGVDETSVTYMLRDPSGNVCTDGNGGVVCSEEGGGFTCLLSNPATGRWTVEFSTPQTADAGLWLAFAAEEGADVMVNPKLKNRFACVGKEFIVTVEPKIDVRHVQGTVGISAIDSANNVTTFSAKDDGLYPDEVASDGVYSAAISATRAGNYSFVIEADATSPVVFSRSAEVNGVAFESSTTFSGAVSHSVADADGNNLYDGLSVDFGVNVSKAATYRVLATLSDLDGNEIGQAWTDNTDCSAGTQTFRVTFDGWDISEHGACSGYKVSSVSLFEIGDGYEATIDTLTDCHTIIAYSFDQFEHVLIEMKSGGSDAASDADGDGLLDNLTVEIPVHVDDLAAGTYDWSAALLAPNGETIVFTSGTATFRTGENDTFVTMVFPRADIAEKNFDGPYTVSNFILWGSGREFTLSGSYTTRDYKAVQFGGLGHTDLAFAPDEERGDDDGFGLCDADGKPLKSFVQGETVYLYANFRNAMAGEGLDDRFQVAFAWSEEDAVTETCPGLEADEVGKILIPAPGAFRALPPGRYTLTCTLDSGEDYAESDEKNNVGEMSFSVTARGLVRPGTVRPFTTDAGKDYAIRSAVTYGGYLLDAKKKLIGVIDVKLSKPSKIGECAVSGSVTVLGGKKTPLKMPRGTKGTSTGKIDMTAGAETIALEITADTIGGRMGKNTITGVRTDSAAALNAFNNRVYTLALETQKASGSAAPLAAGYSGLSLVVGKKGKVKVSGVIGDGTKVATTAQLLPGDGLSCLPILAQLYTKKAGGFGFLVWFEDNGTITLEGLSDWDAESSKFPFTATFSANVPVCERTDIPGSAFFGIEGNGIQSVGGLPVFTTLLPTKVPVANTGKKWNVEKADKVKLVGTEVQIGRNPAGVTLSYDKKTGAFKGKFSVYADKQGKLKKNAAAVNGVVVDGKGYGTAVIKNTGSMPVTVGKRK